jgi:hypothetical protein
LTTQRGLAIAFSLRTLVLFALVCIILVMASDAQITTYTYTGNAYTSNQIASPQLCPITGYFTLPQPIPPNSKYQAYSSTNFSFTDCASTITNLNTYGGLPFQISPTTNDQGQITAWVWVLQALQSIQITDNEGDTYTTNLVSFQSIENSNNNGDTVTYETSAGNFSAMAPPGTWIGGSPPSGKGVDLSRLSGDVLDSSWQQMTTAGGKFAVVQAWGGLTQSAYAEDQLVGDGNSTHGAQNNGLSTAAYTLLNFLSNRGSGSYQVDQGIAAVGTGIDNLKFMVIDVEPCCGWASWKSKTNYGLPNNKQHYPSEITDPANHIQKVITAGVSGTPKPKWNDKGGTTKDGTVLWRDTGVKIIGKATRIQRISEAVAEIQRNGLQAVIYTDRGSWKAITGNCDSGKTNNCSSLIALPLWDVEHKTFIGSDGKKHCGDGIQGLVPFTPYSSLSWQARSGNQYDFGLAGSAADQSELSASLMEEAPSKSAGCQGNALFGITVDVDVFNPALFQ